MKNRKTQLKILSWNIWIDCDFTEVKDFLGKCGADIIGLQEVKEHDADRDIISYLTSLGYHHVFTPVKKVYSGIEYTDGLAIFSKHTILASEVYNLSQENNRCALKADININGKIVHVFNTHLVHDHQQNSEIQKVQIENLIKVLPKEKAIVMGDFNATPDSRVINKMQGLFKDADSIHAPSWSLDPKGCLVCAPGRLDTRLDYIFTSQDLNTSSFKVHDTLGSDHLAVSTIVDIGE